MLFKTRILVGVVFLIFTWSGVFENANSSDKSQFRSDKAIPNILETNHSFTEIAKSVIPTVVSIYSTMIVETDDWWKQRFNEDELRRFFGDNYYNFPIPQELRRRGSGSGIIISEQGHILTNVHVIDKAEKIKIILSDKRTFDAEIIGMDPLTEVAVIKIDGKNLPVATLGNSDSCQIGEWVLAIGNPLELQSTVTAGIISAKERALDIIGDTYGVENFIQTDAAINPGNSGGPLVNLKGEIIGINTAIATESGYNQGYGFAIPINIAKEIMEDLIYQGRVVRGYLGISMQDIDEIKARALGLKKPVGVFVDSVLKDGPGVKGGLDEKDVILKIDNKPVNSANVVQSIIAKKNPGDEIDITVLRKSKKLTLTIVLGERQYSSVLSPNFKKDKDYRFLGLEVQNLKAEGYDGVVVQAVERYSPAFETGICVNDIIVEIGDTIISSIELFQSIISSLEAGSVIIVKIRRGDTTFHAFIEIPFN